MKRPCGGFALAVFLILAPLLAVMAWTFVCVATETRNQALAAERRLRALHSAESALRYHLVSGVKAELTLNGTRALCQTAGGNISASAVCQDDERRSVTIGLTLSGGFAGGRTHREN